MKLSLITPAKTLFEGIEISEISIPGHEGVLTAREGHAPLLGILSAGFISFYDESKVFHKVFVSWGYFQIGVGGVKIFAEVAEYAEGIDKTLAKEEEAAVLKELSSKTLDHKQIERFQKKLKEARTRLKA